MWADCLGFWSLKKCPQPQTRWGRFLKPQRKPRNVFPGAFGDSSITSRSGTGPFFKRDPPKRWCGGFGEGVQKKKGGDFVMSSRIVFCVFFWFGIRFLNGVLIIICSSKIDGRCLILIDQNVSKGWFNHHEIHVVWQTPIFWPQREGQIFWI